MGQRRPQKLGESEEEEEDKQNEESRRKKRSRIYGKERDEMKGMPKRKGIEKNEKGFFV